MPKFEFVVSISPLPIVTRPWIILEGANGCTSLIAPKKENFGYCLDSGNLWISRCRNHLFSGISV
jgi:hypothetical protein